jgi:hypothetical protein
MIDRLQNGWRLMLQSFAIIRADPRLLLFPVATAALTMIMACLFMTPIALEPTGHAYTESAHWETVGERFFVKGPPTADDLAHGRKESISPKPIALATFALFYFLSMFLATFFNVAFTHAIFNALKSKPVSVSDGLSFAMTKLKPILIWSLFAGVIGYIIKALEQRFGLLGRFIVRLIGAAWSVASVFVIPIIVLEEHPDNPIELVKQSAGVIRKTWGEALAGYAGLQIGGMIVGGTFVFALGVAIFAAIHESYVTTTLVIVGWLGFTFAFSYVMNVASQVYLCVLYRFASSGTVTAGFAPEMLNLAWRPKKA